MIDRALRIIALGGYETKLNCFQDTEVVFALATTDDFLQELARIFGNSDRLAHCSKGPGKPAIGEPGVLPLLRPPSDHQLTFNSNCSRALAYLQARKGGQRLDRMLTIEYQGCHRRVLPEIEDLRKSEISELLLRICAGALATVRGTYAISSSGRGRPLQEDAIR